MSLLLGWKAPHEKKKNQIDFISRKWTLADGRQGNRELLFHGYKEMNSVNNWNEFGNGFLGRHPSQACLNS